jgi:hypothetical protein
MMFFSKPEESRAGLFISCLRKSGLVPNSILEGVLKDMFGTTDPKIESAASLIPLVSQLIEHDFLTLWQAEMLLQGKWRGFHMEDFELRDVIGKAGDEPTWILLARKTGEVSEYVITINTQNSEVTEVWQRPRPRSLSRWSEG